MHRKTSLKYFFSVEGETEKWYLNWLQEQINTCNYANARVEFKVSVEKNPKKKVKSLNIMGKTEIWHVFDFEEIQNEQSFKKTLDHMKEAEALGKKVVYKLGYTNLTFDLWIILHKQCLKNTLNHKRQYLKELNRVYDEQYVSMNEYKEERNFKRILSKLSLNDVIQAIEYAKDIIYKRSNDGHVEIKYKKYSYYKENPSLSLHIIIAKVLKDVGIIY